VSEPRVPLGRQLAELPIPGAEAARGRALARIVQATATEQPVRSRRHRPLLRLALGLAAAALIAGGALAATGTVTVTQLVHDAAPPSAPVTRLPGSGSLLVRSGGQIAIVRADGSLHPLGAFREASWSPHARFVVLTGGRHLVIVDPRTGRQRWTITARAPIHGARWSLEATVPPCCRIAYLTAGATVRTAALHVIAGDGTGDRVVAAADLRVAPAWRPKSTARELAFVDPSGSLRRISATTSGDLVPPLHLPFTATRLAWSADGQRLLVLGAHRLVVLGAGGTRALRRLDARAPDGLVTGSFVGQTRAIAVLRGLAAHRSEVELLPARGPGERLATDGDGLSWLVSSPDGTRILAGNARGDTWMAVGTRRTGALAGASSDPATHPVGPVLDDGWTAGR
jgi:hypothetical protein